MMAEAKDNRELETENLIIRPSCWEDTELFYLWETKPEVTEFFSIRDDQTKEEVVRKYIKDDMDPAAEQFTILLKRDLAGEIESGEATRLEMKADSEASCKTKDKERFGNAEPIGRIVIADIEEGWKAELWRIYIADAALRKRGLGKEAMRAVMAYCFDCLKLERLYLDHYTGNPAAYLYQSLGFKYEGVLRKNCRKNGVLYDVHLMSMLREEYYERRQG